MREKLEPWIPAIFCAVLALITTVGNLLTRQSGGASDSVTSVFILFLPMCFFHVGVLLTKLRNENREMRLRLDKLDKPNPDAAKASVDGDVDINYDH